MAKQKFVFVRGSLPSVVWNPKTGRPLAEFCDPDTKRITGVFTTTSAKVAKTLREMGYKESSDYPDGAPVGGFEERIPDPPNHITPGGPKPVQKVDDELISKSDIQVDETVTNETSSDDKGEPSKKSKKRKSTSKKKKAVKK